MVGGRAHLQLVDGDPRVGREALMMVDGRIEEGIVGTYRCSSSDAVAALGEHSVIKKACPKLVQNSIFGKVAVRI